jgi:hypothetical protein
VNMSKLRGQLLGFLVYILGYILGHILVYSLGLRGIDFGSGI